MDPLRPRASSRPRLADVTDAQLDAAILARLELLGVDISVLPDDDADAPADQRRILASARRFLRSTPGAIADFAMDPQEVPPVLYPAEWAALLDDEPSAGEGA